MSLIPKKVHMSFVSKDFISADLSLIKNGVGNIIKLNPEHTLEISTDEEVNAYIKSSISRKDWNLIKNQHIVEKTDLWRLLKIYNEGGIYVDLDRYCNRSFDEVLFPEDRCVLPTFFEIDFSQDIMMAAPNIEFYKEAAKLNIKRRREGNWKLLDLGPLTYFHAISQHFTGHFPEKHLPANEFKKLCAVIEENSGFRTWRESPDYMTFLCRHPKFSLENTVRDKFALYELYGTEHWGFFDPEKRIKGRLTRWIEWFRKQKIRKKLSPNGS